MAGVPTLEYVSSSGHSIHEIRGHRVHVPRIGERVEFRPETGNTTHEYRVVDVTHQPENSLVTVHVVESRRYDEEKRGDHS